MDIAATSQHNSEARQMADFIQYRRTQIAEMRPWRFGDDMEGISVSEPDRENGSPREGDMIARNPKNYADQWLVATQYFADNFEPFASKSLATPSMAGEDTTGAIRHAFDLLSSAVRCGEDWRPELDGALVKAREAVRSLSSRVEEAERARREEELREDARLGAALARAESSEALVAELREKVERLETLINSPHVDEWFEAVRIESAHQVERWGVDHDAGKTALDWFWLIGYLAQKAVYASLAGDDFKAKHHTISTGAALLNWFRRMTGDTSLMRPGLSGEAQVAIDAARSELEGQ